MKVRQIITAVTVFLFAGVAPMATASTPLTAQAGSTPPDPTLVADQVMGSLAQYWAGVFPTEFGQSFLHLSSGTKAVDSAVGGNGSMCVAQAVQIMGNAYYCPQSDGIVYDIGVLVPVLAEVYGTDSLVAALAHEYGHAIAARVGPTVSDRAADPDRYPALLVELQADCYAGNFLQAAAQGTTGATTVDGDQLTDAIAPLMDFRDRGTVNPKESTAHGLAMDRLQAVLLGWAGSPSRCHTFTLADIRLTLAYPQLKVDFSTPRFPGDEEVLTATRGSLATFLADKSLDHQAIGDAVEASAEVRTSVHAVGQFGLAAASVHAGFSGLLEPATAACWTGSWVGAVFGSDRSGANGLGAWAGDADEALDAFRLTSPGTDELVAYSRGFADGPGSCGQR